MHTRRNAIKLGIAAIVSMLASRAPAQDLSGKTVIVIGAGIAGLAAGQALRKSGATVIVLEAGDYVGGRIRTDRSMGAPFEHGAGWIHGPSAQNPIQQLANQIGASTYVTDDDSLTVFGPGGAPLPPAGIKQIDDSYDRLPPDIYDNVEWGDERSISEVLAELNPGLLKDPFGQWLLSAYVEFDLGAGIEDISAINAFEDRAFDGADVVLLEGYDTILAPLKDGLDIRLGTPVTQIGYGVDGVKVNNLSADYAICTVPLGVLKAGGIQFDPPLPNPVQAAITELGFGTVTKLALKFDAPFWDVNTQYFGITTNPKGRWNYWLNYRTFSDENILLGLSFGRYAPIADRMSQQEMTTDALDVLRSVWGQSVSIPKAVLSTHWSENPLFRGAYSYPQAGGSPEQFDVFAKPVKDRLFFAGEHTIFDYHSTTHGALMTGVRAADAIRTL